MITLSSAKSMSMIHDHHSEQRVEDIGCGPLLSVLQKSDNSEFTSNFMCREVVAVSIM